jgi:hypothetical protein
MIIEQRREVIHRVIKPGTGEISAIHYGHTMISIEKDRTITGNATAIRIDGRWYLPATESESRAMDSTWERSK